MRTSSNGNIFRVTGHLCGSPVISPHKGQWRGALMFSLICARINGWVNNREAGDLRRHQAHCDVMRNEVCDALWCPHMSTTASQITSHSFSCSITYDDVIKCKHFPPYWDFLRGIHRLPSRSLWRHCNACSSRQQRKHRNSPITGLMWIYMWPMDSPHKGQVTWKSYPYHDVIIYNYMATGYQEKLFWKNATIHHYTGRPPICTWAPS